MILTRLSNPSQCQFDIALFLGVEISDNIPDYTGKASDVAAESGLPSLTTAKADLEQISRMDVLDDLLKFSIQNHDYAIKRSGFGPDYQQGLSVWYLEKEDNLQESLGY
jgi:hypothetical protein